MRLGTIELPPLSGHTLPEVLVYLHDLVDLIRVAFRKQRDEINRQEDHHASLVRTWMKL